MTSVKCFSNWFKEAGRGHLSAFLSWGILIIYGITMLTRLSFDTDFTYFGIGSMELVWICAGIGILLAFFEFFYLLQSRKQDLYYSLPVSKSMIFWSRYVHGLVHFLAPLILVLVVCGIYEGSLDIQFLKVSVSYTGKSILTAAAVFLIFYHLGVVCLTVCGNIISAVLSCGVFLSFGDLFLQNVCDVFARNCFQTYYRLPLLERLADLMEQTLESRRKELPLGTIQFRTVQMEEAMKWNQAEHPYEGLEDRCYYPVYPSFARTLEALEEAGISPKLMNEDIIESVAVYHYAVYGEDGTYDDSSDTAWNAVYKEPAMIRELAPALSGKNVVLFHEAYEYVARDYGMQVVYVMDLDEERQVSAGEVAEMLSAVREGHVTAVLAEELYGSEMGAVVEQETDAGVCYLDTLVRGDYDSDSYLERMKQNIAIMREIASGESGGELMPNQAEGIAAGQPMEGQESEA